MNDLSPDGHLTRDHPAQGEPPAKWLPRWHIGTMSRPSIPGRLLSSRARFRFLGPTTVPQLKRPFQLSYSQRSIIA